MGKFLGEAELCGVFLYQGIFITFARLEPEAGK